MHAVGGLGFASGYSASNVSPVSDVLGPVPAGWVVSDLMWSVSLDLAGSVSMTAALVRSAQSGLPAMLRGVPLFGGGVDVGGLSGVSLTLGAGRSDELRVFVGKRAQSGLAYVAFYVSVGGGATVGAGHVSIRAFPPRPRKKNGEGL